MQIPNVLPSLPLALALLTTAAAQDLPTPEQHLGRPVGTDFQLADWDQTRTYFEALSASPRLELRRMGTSQEGRDLVLAVISSEENLARSSELRRHSRVLSDPRGRTEAELAAAVEEGKVILFITSAMHATETAAPEMSMELAWNLVSSDEEPWKSAREEVVVCLVPNLNPDGQDHVVSWYRETVGGPFEATGLLKLYQKYAGHDNNRDWFMLSLAESRLLTEQLYRVWRPQVLWDVHQQGSTRERMFVPPFRDPLNPRVDPGILTGIDLIGTRALFDLTREGFEGISTGVSYDMWWNGGNRNVPVRHNVIGLLTEAASVDIATPLFLPRSELSPPRGLGSYAPSNQFPDPWPGGWWTLRKIIDYELGFARSLLGTLAREGELFRRNSLEAARRTIERGRDTAPRAWVVPSDNLDVGAVRRMVQTLLWSGIEIHRAEAAFEAEGRTWPAGSLLLRRDQPYGAHLADLFEIQRFPDGHSPYDVSGWTLPLLMGVERAELVNVPEGEFTRTPTVNDSVEAFSGDARIGFPQGGWLSLRDTDKWTELIRTLQRGEPMTYVTRDERSGIVVPGEQAANLNEEPIVLSGVPRIGVYAPWRGLKNEGWLRWVLDTWQIPYTTIRNETIRGGRLADVVDVLVLPSVSSGQLDDGRAEGTVASDWTRGLAPEGAVAIEEFVRGGGTLIAMEGSTPWVIDLFRLPLVDVSRGEESGEFSCPGSVLRTVPWQHQLTAGLAPSVPVFFSRGHAWRDMTEDEREQRRLTAHAPETLLEWAPARLLYSGWIQQPEVIAGRKAWVRARHGEGKLHLFAFRPQYRSWSQAAFHLLFRAMLLDRD